MNSWALAGTAATTAVAIYFYRHQDRKKQLDSVWVNVNVLPPVGWTVVSLPFLPVAINDADVIVGNSSTDGGAVRYDEGAMKRLPRGEGGTAVDITNDGAILGIPNDDAVLGIPDNREVNAVIWKPPDLSVEFIDNAPFGYFVPGAMNNNLLVVGEAGDARLALKWSDTQGYEVLNPHEAGYGARATDVNDGDYVVGYDYSTGGHGRILLWSPNGSVTALGRRGAGGGPYIRKNGEVVWAYYGSIRRWSAGKITTSYAPAGMERLTAVSDSGRLAGTLKLNGVLRGWTFSRGAFSYLDPWNAAPGDYVEPTGINASGSIVGVVHRTGRPDYGVYFARSGSGVVYWRDWP